jgi:glycogen debranching enzyme
MKPPAVDRDVCRDFFRSSKLEWLETNGTGAFAMGTVAGVNTRRYHALLLASLRPPVERYVLLSRMEEEALVDGTTYALGACQYPGSVAPRGFELLEDFSHDPCASWRWTAGHASIEKQVYLPEGRQAVVIRYRADRPVRLRVRPFLAYRDYHSMSHANGSLNGSVEVHDGVARIKPYDGLPALEFHSHASFEHDGHWYNNIEYLADLDRGLDFREDLYTPGVLVLDLEPGAWSSILASADGSSGVPQPPAARRDPFIVKRADGKSTIIAGYPWFTDWGRDTMISLPGLLIAAGRLDEARSIIEGFLEHMNQGVIPNRFPDAGETPEYNTVDATLWMFQAVRQYLAAGGDRSFLGDVFYPAARQIIDWHHRGTWYDIHVDPEDSLLSAGYPGTQLTWMDAKVGDWVVTPRHGKAVEINALWHGALLLTSEWGADLGDLSAGMLLHEAARVRESFVTKFWNADRDCLYDVLQAEGLVGKIRPNQIFAVSLQHGILDQAHQQAVVRAVERELLTPVGLRTLERGDPEYKPRFEGTPLDRDGAYHQGTVWPWLIGPYVDAYLCAFGETPNTLAHCRQIIDTLEIAATVAGCPSSIAEIYDAEEPRYPRGCPAQAWSVAEVARIKKAYGWDGGAKAAGVTS